MRRPSCSTSLAPMCWVMPPRSPAATVRRADRVEQARLAVVDVAHDGHDRRAARRAGRVVVLLEEDVLGGLAAWRLAVGLDGRSAGRASATSKPSSLGHEAGRVAVDELVDAREDAALDELADDVRGVDAEELGELLDGDRVRESRPRRASPDRRSGRPFWVAIRPRRGGLRGPRVLRVPLRLRAMGDLRGAPRGRRAASRSRSSGGSGMRERALERRAPDGQRPAGASAHR